MASKRQSSRVQPNLLRKLNVRTAIEILQQNGPCSRADLTRYMGISPPTASKTVTSLLSLKLVEEVDALEGALGRPGKLLQFSSTTRQLVGAVLDTKECWVGLSSFDGELAEERSITFATPATYPQLIDQLAEQIGKLLDQCESVIGIGLSSPGLTNAAKQKTIFSPNLPVTNDQAPARDLSDRLGVDCIVFQEMHALAHGERLFGAARGVDDFAVIDTTSGLGLGVVSGGKLIDGHQGMAGELGHITVEPQGLLCGCGNRGCLETVAADGSFLRRISEACGEELDLETVAKRIAAGELHPETEISQFAEYLGIALATVVNIFNPTHIFVHGNVFDLVDGVWPQVVEKARQRSLGPPFDQCEILRARGNKQQGAIAGMIEHYLDSLAPALEK